MKYNNDFRHDLEFSTEQEKNIGQKIFNRDINTIEVKVDRKAVITGNIFIETSSRGKQSGILTTEADFVFYHLEGTEMGLYFETELLRKTVKRLIPTHFKLGGDSNTSEGVLINISELVKEINKTRQKELLANNIKNV